MADHLTGSPSKSATFAALRGGVSRAFVDPPVRSTYLAVAEFEHFLNLRRQVGYSCANALMNEIATRVAKITDLITIGRIGRSSVEFSMQVLDREEAEALLGRVAGEIAKPVIENELEFRLMATIAAVDLGLGPIHDAALDLVASASAEARTQGLAISIVAKDDSLCRESNELALLRDMPDALRTGDLQLHYQPKLRIRTNQIDAAEGLVRWNHPQFGQVAVEPFIRMLEETGGIRRLSEWVISQAVTDLAVLRAAGHHLTLWINLSATLIADTSFIELALGLLADVASGIGLEITETAVINHPERALSNLAALAAAGIKIAIDDYGSGLSSLAYLKQLPAQELKIDRLFIKDLVDDHRDPLLVKSTIDLAHALEMEVTAEGVDNALTLALLRNMGCDAVQGYVLSPALPLDELTTLLGNDSLVRGITAPRAPSAWFEVANARLAQQSE